MNRLGLGVILSIGLCAASPLDAQQAPPGCKTPMHRQFDFWVGSWVVTDSAGTRTLGHNEITLETAGCVIHERWTSAGTNGGTGQSLNVYDLATRQWAQDWVGSGGDVLHLRGGLKGSAMVLTGEGMTPSGAKQLNRVTWTPMPDGRVRQHWETSDDGGVTWAKSFDGWYRKTP
jgi:hypothetical protein